jgi:hypothetical protein
MIWCLEVENNSTWMAWSLCAPERTLGGGYVLECPGFLIGGVYISSLPSSFSPSFLQHSPRRMWYQKDYYKNPWLFLLVDQNSMSIHK